MRSLKLLVAERSGSDTRRSMEASLRSIGSRRRAQERLVNRLLRPTMFYKAQPVDKPPPDCLSWRSRVAGRVLSKNGESWRSRIFWLVN